MADYSQLMSLERKAKASPVAQQNTSAGLPTNQQTSKEVNQQVGKETNQQTYKPANLQTTKEKKKYSTYLKEESISAIQMRAIQTKQKDHEVLQEIVDAYFASKPVNQ